MKRGLAVLVIAVGSVIPVVGTEAVVAPSTALACTYEHEPDGTKCLQAGEYCSHKPGYAAGYHRAGYYCARDGRLEIGVGRARIGDARLLRGHEAPRLGGVGARLGRSRRHGRLRASSGGERKGKSE